jgi:carbon-monoxide dehydrogenase large subunit
MNAVFQGIGASVRRKEDLRFISGHGHYTDDINRPNQSHAIIKRSDRPHANIRAIDTSAAKAAPGVVAIYTHTDLEAAALGGIPCGWQIHSKDGSAMAEPMHPILASGKVRHVGDPVVVVIAETKQQAKDAAELVVIDYEDLPAVSTMRDALKPGAPQLHAEAPNNLCFDWHLGDKELVDRAWCRTRWRRGLPSAITTR